MFATGFGRQYEDDTIWYSKENCRVNSLLTTGIVLLAELEESIFLMILTTN